MSITTPVPRFTPSRSVHRRFLPWLLGLTVLANACRSAPPPPPPQPQIPEEPPCEKLLKADWPVRLYIRPTARMNASPEGTPLDTLVRIMQVRSVDRLTDVPIRQLWNNTQEVLGPDLLWSETKTVQIDGGLNFRLALQPEAQYLVIAAWLRNPMNPGFWRAVPLPLHYQVGTCEEERRDLPSPCAFAVIGERSVEIGLTPPDSFDPTGIEARCPSPLLLNSTAKPRP